MKVRAIAIATDRSNAVGTVELECTAYGLALIHLGVAAFSEGYTPGALTSGTRVIVPWSGVRQARVEGEQVFLELDPRATPHSRLTLVNFSAGDTVHHREVYRQRLVLRIGTTGAAIVSLLVAALTLPRLAPHVSAGAALGVGVLAAGAVLAVGLLAERRIARGGADSDAAREAFAAELSIYLPSLIRRPEAPRPAPKLPSLPSIQGVLPRTTLAIVITLTAGLLAVVLMGRWVVSGGAEQPPRAAAVPPPPAEQAARAEPIEERASNRATAARAAPPPPGPAEPQPAPAPTLSDLAEITGPCQCDRADSVLWADPIPRLSTLVLAERKHRVGRQTHLEVDIAAVNNGDTEIRELTLVLEFFEQDPPPSSKRYSVALRSVYYEGPLAPGKAIKWTVEARGTEFEIQQNPIAGQLGPHGEGAAPANFVAELLDANHRPVRLHGAMMLAYLRDPRAREAALTLREALREDEAAYLQRIIIATSELKTCQLEVTPAGPVRAVRACVYNASGEPKRNLALRVRGLASRFSHTHPVAPPPLMATEATWQVPAELAAQQGVLVSAQMDVSRAGQNAIAMFEAVADRADLLR